MIPSFMGCFFTPRTTFSWLHLPYPIRSSQSLRILIACGNSPSTFSALSLPSTYGSPPCVSHIPLALSFVVASIYGIGPHGTNPTLFSVAPFPVPDQRANPSRPFLSLITIVPSAVILLPITFRPVLSAVFGLSRISIAWPLHLVGAIQHWFVANFPMRVG